jgi:LCP family protein required for cell wall assembly
VVVAVLLILVVAAYFFFDAKLHRRNVLADYSGRPAQGAGQNWLITGSDSRQGLSSSQERRFSTGFDVSGHRSDTVMVLHIPSNGEPPVLVSLPRDSYVPIPGNGYNKINAAYAFGGPKLLAQTVQNATGLRIDHSMEIGFGGLVRVVNAVGGVRMCFKTPVHDSYSGVNLKAGCHTLSGGQALSFVRDRHSFGTSDLQRVQDQRLFMSALLRKVTSPATFLNPFSAVPATFGATGALTVDRGTHLYQLLEVAFALRHPKTTTVPISGSIFTPAVGDALQWDHAKASLLFNDLNQDKHVPKSLLSGSHLGS